MGVLQYREEQHIRNGILRIITMITAGILFMAFWKNRHSATVAIICSIIFLIATTIFFFVWTLKLTFTADDRFISLRIKYLQTGAQKLRWEDIDQIWQADIDAVKDFGGWGLRYNEHGTGYIFRSTSAVFFKMKQGQEITVTTGRGDEFMNMVAINHPELLSAEHSRFVAPA